MAVTKKTVMGLTKLLKKARDLATTHPDTDINTTVVSDINTILSNMTGYGVIDES